MKARLQSSLVRDGKRQPRAVGYVEAWHHEGHEVSRVMEDGFNIVGGRAAFHGGSAAYCRQMPLQRDVLYVRDELGEGAGPGEEDVGEGGVQVEALLSVLDIGSEIHVSDFGAALAVLDSDASEPRESLDHAAAGGQVGVNVESYARHALPRVDSELVEVYACDAAGSRDSRIVGPVVVY